MLASAVSGSSGLRAGPCLHDRRDSDRVEAVRHPRRRSSASHSATSPWLSTKPAGSRHATISPQKVRQTKVRWPALGGVRKHGEGELQRARCPAAPVERHTALIVEMVQRLELGAADDVDLGRRGAPPDVVELRPLQAPTPRRTRSRAGRERVFRHPRFGRERRVTRRSTRRSERAEPGLVHVLPASTSRAVLPPARHRAAPLGAGGSGERPEHRCLEIPAVSDGDRATVTRGWSPPERSEPAGRYERAARSTLDRYEPPSFTRYVDRGVCRSAWFRWAASIDSAVPRRRIVTVRRAMRDRDQRARHDVSTLRAIRPADAIRGTGDDGPWTSPGRTALEAVA
jgi:hypothetical protein